MENSKEITESVGVDHVAIISPRCDGQVRVKNILHAIVRECPSVFTCLESNEEISEEDVHRFHTTEHFDEFFKACEESCNSDCIVSLSNDCHVGPNTWNVVMYGAQCAIIAVDRVTKCQHRSALCIIAPPGHHAKPNGFGGFCFLNNVGIAAKYALQQAGISRVAVLDFDVHHGDGTEEGFCTDEKLFYGSTHIDAYSVDVDTRIVSHHIDNRKSFRYRWRDIVEKMVSFKPDFVIFSAGFDAHVNNVMHLCDLTDDDFGWATQVAIEACTTINPDCPPKYISVLEEGNDLTSLESGAVAHLKALAGVAYFGDETHEEGGDSAMLAADVDSVVLGTHGDSEILAGDEDSVTLATHVDSVMLASYVDSAMLASYVDSAMLPTHVDSVMVAAETLAANVDSVGFATHDNSVRSATDVDAVRLAADIDSVRMATVADSVKSTTDVDSSTPARIMDRCVFSEEIIGFFLPQIQPPLECTNCANVIPSCDCNLCGPLCPSCLDSHSRWRSFASHNVIHRQQDDSTNSPSRNPLHMTLRESTHALPVLEARVSDALNYVAGACVANTRSSGYLKRKLVQSITEAFTAALDGAAEPILHCQARKRRVSAKRNQLIALHTTVSGLLDTTSLPSRKHFEDLGRELEAINTEMADIVSLTEDALRPFEGEVEVEVVSDEVEKDQLRLVGLLRELLDS